jgi:phosphoribosylamine--glycine ligase
MQLPQLPDVKVFHAGTDQLGHDVVTNGGRVLGVTALG